jgi:hypothetical protein
MFRIIVKLYLLGSHFSLKVWSCIPFVNFRKRLPDYTASYSRGMYSWHSVMFSDKFWSPYAVLGRWGANGYISKLAGGAIRPTCTLIGWESWRVITFHSSWLCGRVKSCSLSYVRSLFKCVGSNGAVIWGDCLATVSVYLCFVEMCSDVLCRFQTLFFSSQATCYITFILFCCLNKFLKSLLLLLLLFYYCGCWYRVDILVTRVNYFESCHNIMCCV